MGNCGSDGGKHPMPHHTHGRPDGGREYPSALSPQGYTHQQPPAQPAVRRSFRRASNPEEDMTRSIQLASLFPDLGPEVVATVVQNEKDESQQVIILQQMMQERTKAEIHEEVERNKSRLLDVSQPLNDSQQGLSDSQRASSSGLGVPPQQAPHPPPPVSRRKSMPARPPQPGAAPPPGEGAVIRVGSAVCVRFQGIWFDATVHDVHATHPVSHSALSAGERPHTWYGVTFEEDGRKDLVRGSDVRAR